MDGPRACKRSIHAAQPSGLKGCVVWPTNHTARELVARTVLGTQALFFEKMPAQECQRTVVRLGDHMHKPVCRATCLDIRTLRSRTSLPLSEAAQYERHRSRWPLRGHYHGKNFRTESVSYGKTKVSLPAPSARANFPARGSFPSGVYI